MTVILETLSFSDTALLDLDSSTGAEQIYRVAVDAHIRYTTNVVLIVGNLKNVRLKMSIFRHTFPILVEKISKADIRGNVLLSNKCPDSSVNVTKRS